MENGTLFWLVMGQNNQYFQNPGLNTEFVYPCIFQDFER